MITSYSYITPLHYWRRLLCTKLSVTMGRLFPRLLGSRCVKAYLHRISFTQEIRLPPFDYRHWDISTIKNFCILHYLYIVNYSVCMTDIFSIEHLFAVFFNLNLKEHMIPSEGTGLLRVNAGFLYSCCRLSPRLIDDHCSISLPPGHVI